MLQWFGEHRELIFAASVVIGLLGGGWLAVRAMEGISTEGSSNLGQRLVFILWALGITVALVLFVGVFAYTSTALVAVVLDQHVALIAGALVGLAAGVQPILKSRRISWKSLGELLALIPMCALIGSMLWLAFQGLLGCGEAGGCGNPEDYYRRR